MGHEVLLLRVCMRMGLQPTCVCVTIVDGEDSKWTRGRAIRVMNAVPTNHLHHERILYLQSVS